MLEPLHVILMRLKSEKGQRGRSRSIGEWSPSLDDGGFHLHVAVPSAAVMIADDRKVAGGVGCDGDIGSLTGQNVGVEFERFRKKPWTRSELVTRRITGWPLLSVISFGVNSNFFAVISITLGFKSARAKFVFGGTAANAIPHAAASSVAATILSPNIGVFINGSRR
jgi:hypothetical protein